MHIMFCSEINFLSAYNEPVALWTRASCLIIFGTVNIWTIAERSISFPDWSPTSLVQIVPVETSKWSMMCTPTLKKIWTLLRPKLFQVSGENKTLLRYHVPCHSTTGTFTINC